MYDYYSCTAITIKIALLEIFPKFHIFALQFLSSVSTLCCALYLCSSPRVSIPYGLSKFVVFVYYRKENCSSRKFSLLLLSSKNIVKSLIKLVLKAHSFVVKDLHIELKCSRLIWWSNYTIYISSTIAFYSSHWLKKEVAGTCISFVQGYKKNLEISMIENEDSTSGNELGELPVVGNEDIKTSYVSGWDDDTEGVEEELNPHGSANKEILWAAENGETDTILKLIKENPSIVHVRDKDGYTPLHRACYNNHVDAVEILIQNGANIAAKTEDGWQPLHSACKWNNASCAAKLLAYGADVNALTEGDLTPLHLAAGNSYAKETLELLLMHHNINPDIKSNSNETAYQIARRSGRYYKLFEITEPCFQL